MLEGWAGRESGWGVSAVKGCAGTMASKPETGILALLADGLQKKEIAEKLNVPNAPAAVAKAYKSGLFSSES